MAKRSRADVHTTPPKAPPYLSAEYLPPWDGDGDDGMVAMMDCPGSRRAVPQRSKWSK